MAQFIQPNLEFLPNIEDIKDEREDEREDELFNINIFRYKFNI